MALDDYNCVLCNDACEETCFHLFFECAFRKDCQSTLSINWDLSLSLLDMILKARGDFDNVIFREIFITTCQVIWTTRNGVIDNGQVDVNLWKGHFKEELGLVCAQAKRGKLQLVYGEIVTYRAFCVLSFLGPSALYSPSFCSAFVHKHSFI